MGETGTIRVVAAVVARDGRYLVCRRPLDKRHGGLWEFPGGKLEPGETLDQAARRELAEELGVTVVAVGERLLALQDPGARFVVEFHPVEIHGEPKCLEHMELRWAAGRDLLALPLAPSDRKFAATLPLG